MTSQLSVQATHRLKHLILARLLAKGRPPVYSDIERGLRPYFLADSLLGKEAWRDTLKNSLEELQDAGLLRSKPLELTDCGRSETEKLLFASETATSVPWRTLRNRYVIARALEIEPRSKTEWRRLATADGTRAAVLRQHFQLPLTVVPTLSKVLDAIAWQQLSQSHDVDDLFTTRFDRRAVLRVTLLNGSKVKDQGVALATIVSGAKNASADNLRQAIITRWVHDQQPSEVSDTTFDLTKFARRVSELASEGSTGRFGDDKIFISHVWRRYCSEGGGVEMTRREFDRHLVDANRESLLTLARADLVSAMSPEDVQQSEIQLSNSSFHFIRTDSQAI